MDESALIRATLAGDREAFASLVCLHQARLRALVALAIPGRDDVHDIVQDALVDAYRHLADFDQQREFGPWLRAICRNRMYKHLRRRAGRPRELSLVDEALAADLPDCEGPALDQAAERLQALRACLAALEEGHRRLLTWRYHEGLAVKDIAARLGKSGNGVSMLLLRLKAALMRCVERRLAGAPDGR